MRIAEFGMRDENIKPNYQSIIFLLAMKMKNFGIL
jgi:hypothetical protein